MRGGKAGQGLRSKGSGGDDESQRAKARCLEGNCLKETTTLAASGDGESGVLYCQQETGKAPVSVYRTPAVSSGFSTRTFCPAYF
jgi:hypothetical protein